MLLDMNNNNNDLENPRVYPDSPLSDETRVSDSQNDLSESKSRVSDYDSMLSMFDEYASDEKGKITGEKESFNHNYEIGDMVWGKVKSHPWWPGHIYDESFASPTVRRSKRKGFVLVAFFGDSSYGYFDPDELVPFEPHYAEKSKQINSKMFLKAVEEAADEASRRRGLGLACKCRNPFNFRPANVKGYFAVDMGDKDPAAVYSTDQIKRARNDFRAKDVVAFMKGLAVRPKKDGRGKLDFLKDKAGVLAYRRAVYEEFDETYAQAFGQLTVQPSAGSREAFMHSVKAPLSGPMVIAEALGKKKTPMKSGKKDHTNKDKYLFKRRDEAKTSKSQETGQITSSVLQPCVEVSTQLADGDYVLQRRASLVPPDQQTPAEQIIATEDSKPSDPNGSIVKSLPSERFSDPTRGGVSITKKSEHTNTSSNNDEKLAPTSKSIEGQDSKIKVEPRTKKAKNLKRPLGDLGADRSVSGQKKKKIKKEPGTDMNSDRVHKLGSTGKEGVSGVKVAKKPVKYDPEPQKKDDREDDSSLPISVGKTELKLVDLLHGLQSLALDPFRGSVGLSPALIRQAFLKFRTHVFQKSLVLSPPHEMEKNKNYDLKYPPGKNSDSIRPSIKDQSSSKPPKLLFRVEDPTKGGRKRGPSDRQEEVAAKRLKKVTEIKSLTADKKALGDGKDSVIARPSKPPRVEPRKKMDAPRKIRELTMLVMKFPPQSTLPSENELKARLARFGPLDHSRTRVFWKSFSCRVVFLYKSDAEAAFKYLSENNTLFGGVRVRCHTRSLEAPGPLDLETKVQKDDVSVENMSEFRAVPVQSTVQIKSCLKKSTPEVGPTPGSNGGSKVTSRVKFVLVGGENSSGVEQLVNKSNLNNISFADGGNIDSSSSVTTDTTSYGQNLNNKNFQQKVTLQNPLSNFNPQVASQFPNTAIHVHYPQTTPTNTHNVNTTKFVVAQAGPSSTNTDIAKEMLTLMTRCNDLVINLKSSLGYVPYYSL